MDRRQFLIGALTVVPAALAGCAAGAEESPEQRHAAGKAFEVAKTEEEWRKALTPAQFRVLRDHDTERAGSSPLDSEKRRGAFHCAGCDLPLFSSTAKFDSGTGWPSFTAPLDGAVGTSIDRSLFDIRTEVHCRRCGGPSSNT